MRRSVALCITLCFMLLLSGCGFHLRNGHELPRQLQRVYFTAANPDDIVSTELRDTLTSLNIKLVDTPQQAAYTLELSRSVTTHSRANLNNTSRAATLTYQQTINVAIIDNKTQKTVVSSNFSASVSQLLNQNQIMTANTSSLATQSLPHDLVTHIFIWLTTSKVHDALNSQH